jgi:hypothetical protein
MSPDQLMPAMWWPDQQSFATAEKMCPNIDVSLLTLDFVDSMRGLTLEQHFPGFGFESWLDMWRHWVSGARRAHEAELAKVETAKAVEAALEAQRQSDEDMWYENYMDECTRSEELHRRQVEALAAAEALEAAEAEECASATAAYEEAERAVEAAEAALAEAERIRDAQVAAKTLQLRRESASAQ